MVQIDKAVFCFLFAQEMRDFLSLSIGEKSARASQAKKTRDKETLLDDEDKEQEENEKTNPIKLSKNKTALPKQTAARRELKKMLMKRGKLHYTSRIIYLQRPWYKTNKYQY